eukprot:TRINITY_DN1272_c5_g1_i1.p1 TRINITY_DN1272_c5_g1~~TRINITY_DN1272_c5_g1_i1.p1  ORF type:complete len:770 (-),score=171.91 TRINITY_DN1272_c5_g1_i1:93-2162(-)
MPPSLRGRMLEFSLELDPTYFEKLPGPNDGTWIHDYTLSIPPVRFGVIYKTGTAWAGKVFWTSGRAHNIQMSHWLDKAFTAQEAKLIDEEQLDALREVSSIAADRPTALENYWRSLNQTHNKVISFSTIDADIQRKYTTQLNQILFNFASVDPSAEFPIRVNPINGPDIAHLYLLLKTTAAQVPFGWQRASSDLSVLYQDFTNQTKYENYGSGFEVYAQGAWIYLYYSGTLISHDGKALADSSLRVTDSGFIRIDITVQNGGNAPCYFVTMQTQLLSALKIATGFAQPAGVTLIEDPVTGALNVTIETGESLTPGETRTVSIYCSYPPYNTVYKPSSLSASRHSLAAITYPPRRFANGGSATLDLTRVQGERTVTQQINKALEIAIDNDPRPAVILSVLAYSDDNVVLSLSNPVSKSNLYKYMDISTYGMSTAWTIYLRWMLSATLSNGTEVPFMVVSTTDSGKTVLDVKPPAGWTSLRLVTGIGCKAFSTDSNYYMVAESNTVEVAPKKSSIELWQAIALPLLFAFGAGLAALLWYMQRKKNWQPETKADAGLASVLASPQEQQAIQETVQTGFTMPPTQPAAETTEMEVKTAEGEKPRVHYAVTAQYLMRGVVNVKIVDVDPNCSKVKQVEAEVCSATIRRPKRLGGEGDDNNFNAMGEDEEDSNVGCWGRFTESMGKTCCCRSKKN